MKKKSVKTQNIAFFMANKTAKEAKEVK